MMMTFVPCRAGCWGGGGGGGRCVELGAGVGVLTARRSTHADDRRWGAGAAAAAPLRWCAWLSVRGNALMLGCSACTAKGPAHRKGIERVRRECGGASAMHAVRAEAACVPVCIGIGSTSRPNWITLRYRWADQYRQRCNAWLVLLAQAQAGVAKRGIARVGVAAGCAVMLGGPCLEAGVPVALPSPLQRPACFARA